MLDTETKTKIDSARDILVGKIPDPTAQVDQITTALIYKFMDDMDQESKSLGGKSKFFTGDFKKYSWPKIIDRKLSGQERMDLYMQAINQLPKNEKLPSLFREIFKNAFLPYRDAETLNLFLKEINGFTYDHSENLGNAFEYLLSILGSQGDAGQFRTPRHIIDFMVEVVNPKKEESILDPACGTSGFLISSYKHIIKKNSGNYKPDKDNYSFARNEPSASTVQIQSNGKYKGEKLTPTNKNQLQKNIIGYDISPKMVKLSLVNMYLHNFKKPQIYEYDTLTNTDCWEDDFNVILANPPFMSPKGGIRPHNKFSIQANRSEVLFVDYIAEHLTINGRAGIIVPEGIIFKSDKAYKALRKMLVEDQFLWAVVSLPAKIFEPYSGVKTSILFLDKKRAKPANEILFVDVQNDGFDLGATRRKIEKNDLPEVFKVLQSWSKGKKKKTNIAHWVKKQKIAENGDYNLTGIRYKTDIYIDLRNIVQNFKEILAPLSEDLLKMKKSYEQWQKTEEYKSVKKQLEMLLKKINDTVTSQEFLNTGKQIQDAVKQLKNSATIYDFRKILKTQKYLAETLQYQQKWPIIKLGEITEIVRGGSPRPIQKYITTDKNGINWIKIGDVNKNVKYITKTKQKIKKEGVAKTRLVKIGDFILSNSMSFGRPYILKINGAIHDGWLLIRINDNKKVFSDFLYQILKSNVIQEQYKKLATGGVVKNLNSKLVKSVKIPLPPLEVQKEIVAEIESYQKIIIAAKQIVENWKPTLKIDRSWAMVNLGKVCDVRDGTHESPKYVSVGIPFITSKNLKDNNISFENVRFISQKDHNNFSKRSKVDDGDVLFGMIGTIGNPVVVKKDREFSIKNVALFKFKNNKVLLNYYLQILLSSKFTKNTLLIKARGGSQKFVSLANLRDFQIPLPPMEVQKGIAERVEKEKVHVKSCKELIKINQKKIQQKINEVWEQI